MPRNLSKLIKGGYGKETGYFDISGTLEVNGYPYNKIKRRKKAR